MKFGVHVSKAGGFRNALREAIELQCDTIQVFSGNPRTLRQPKIDEDDVSAFRQGLDKESIGPLVIHAPYLLNLASQETTLNPKMPPHLLLYLDMRCPLQSRQKPKSLLLSLSLPKTIL
jgi:deoxyribonuclease-4